MASIGDTVVLPDGRTAVVTDTFHEYGSEAYDAMVLETGEQVWVSDKIDSEAYRAPYRVNTHDYWRSYCLQYGGSGTEQYFRPRIAVKGAK